ncbi:hypothetical protein BLNAU_17246 [Blattamonas nauphoetae]|uniref:Uncharacterized protein n=1 Tax=Blattamonas nauphoetae TaxID=2049346 RepID=A0ABQ9X7I7_9EUKA|nr:hypothetical protein BLNAU_17246 [Blattamonas nauphoetae]
MDEPTPYKVMSIDSVLVELTRSRSDVSVIVNTPFWNAIPLLIREWDGKDEGTMMRLLDEMLRILTLISDSEVAVANKRHLLSSLSTLSQNPTLPKKIHTRAGQCLFLLDSVPDGPFVLVETEEFRKLEQTQFELEKRTSEITQHEKELETTINVLQLELEEKERMVEERQRQAEEQKRQAQRDKEKLSDEVNRTKEELRTARGRMETSEREKREMAETMERMKLQLAGLPIWVGTECLQTLNRTAHTLTPTKLTQIYKGFVGSKDWRTALTHPIDEGEWELKIRASEDTFKNVMLGFLRYPLPEKATQTPCGGWKSGIGGEFGLWNGDMWKDAKEFKPAGTNKKCDRIGQTAAIRVNIRTREARLFVDDEEQPGIFTDIPSPLCLGVTTGFTDSDNQSVEVLWLKRLK